MSEYQYYEFRALDRRLTKQQIAELRASSTRASITPTRFVNEYSYGDFRDDEDAWMEEYFEAFIYLANWGTHTFKLSLPAGALDLATARQYCTEAFTASAREKKRRLIFTFVSQEEGGDGWLETEGVLASLIPVRAALARGDLRALYLAWLLTVQDSDIDEAAVEPPVPAGLARLSPRARALLTFCASIPISSPRQLRRAPHGAALRSFARPASRPRKSGSASRPKKKRSSRRGAIALPPALGQSISIRSRARRRASGRGWMASSRR